MPISQKILSEVEKIEGTKEEKDLLIRILEMEDGGLRNFTAPYEKEIVDYIAKQEEAKR